MKKKMKTKSESMLYRMNKGKKKKRMRYEERKKKIEPKIVFFCSVFYFFFLSFACICVCVEEPEEFLVDQLVTHPVFFFFNKYREEGRINLLIVQLEKVLDYREGQMDEVNTEDEERLVGCLFCPFFVLYCLVFFPTHPMVPIYPKDFIAHLAVFPERS
ncbi:hypothetical protein OUZ56_006839 [Daphnia magna]|uniref:Uncharacterized protein n=1 Tax=Daphnia magna TaxID=35525 RepID=A0ABQ9YWU7_9CRUS|nr:hypothetical protein OUZ56_006839 [Daphnia magna]